MRSLWFVMAFLVTGGLLGCGGEDGQATDMPHADMGNSQTTSPDVQTDPLKTLTAFVAAVRAQDKAACLALIHPENRAELERDLSARFPPVPEDPQLSIQLASDGQSAKFRGVEALDKLELKKSDGKWWIAD